MELILTLLSDLTGQSESLPVPSTATLMDIAELARAFGFMESTSPGSREDYELVWQGKVLTNGSNQHDQNDNNNSSNNIHNNQHETPSSSSSLEQWGIQSGDIIVIRPRRIHNNYNDNTNPAPTAAAAAADNNNYSNAPAAVATGGLDFSNLLAAAGVSGTNGTPSSTSQTTTNTGTTSIPAATATTTTTTSLSYRYYPTMNLEEAITLNPHPRAMVTLLWEKEHLWKELRYHHPKLALAVQACQASTNATTTNPGTATEQQQQQHQYSRALSHAEQLWREHVVRGSIQRAVVRSNEYHQERQMRERIERNPSDIEAAAYFSQQTNRRFIEEQFQHVMNEYPESLSKILMLYVPAKINGHDVQAFCDSGAQATIMSKKLAIECRLLDWIDDRFAGTAVGVGTGKILGRIHLVQLEFNVNEQRYYFPCTVTVMDDPPPGAKEMPFLLGLDMMKRHLCQIDLARGVLRFRIGTSASISTSTTATTAATTTTTTTRDGSGVGTVGDYMEVPFLHEKDLDEAQGGTKGFDAEKANKDWMETEEDATGKEDSS